MKKIAFSIIAGIGLFFMSASCFVVEEQTDATADSVREEPIVNPENQSGSSISSTTENSKPEIDFVSITVADTDIPGSQPAVHSSTSSSTETSLYSEQKINNIIADEKEIRNNVGLPPMDGAEEAELRELLRKNESYLEKIEGHFSTLKGQLPQDPCLALPNLEKKLKGTSWALLGATGVCGFATGVGGFLSFCLAIVAAGPAEIIPAEELVWACPTNTTDIGSTICQINGVLSAPFNGNCNASSTPVVTSGIFCKNATGSIFNGYLQAEPLLSHEQVVIGESILWGLVGLPVAIPATCTVVCLVSCAVSSACYGITKLYNHCVNGTSQYVFNRKHQSIPQLLVDLNAS
jgi:hypothetical protein